MIGRQADRLHAPRPIKVYAPKRPTDCQQGSCRNALAIANVWLGSGAGGRRPVIGRVVHSLSRRFGRRSCKKDGGCGELALTGGARGMSQGPGRVTP